MFEERMEVYKVGMIVLEDEYCESGRADAGINLLA